MGKQGGNHSVALLGVLVVSGVITFMALVGIVFTFLLGAGVNRAVETVSPVAFLLLLGVGAVLMVAPDGFGRLPNVQPPHSDRPRLSAFGYGFGFGAIIIPCNPGLIALFFSRTTVVFPEFDSQLEVLAAFLAFGLGIGAPLLAFALLSEPFGEQVTRTLASHSHVINRGVGMILVVVSLYYLLVVFTVVPGVS